MNIKTSIQIHRAIEYIKQDPEFPFDTHDDPEDILEYYNIEIDLEPEEKEILMEEIKEIVF